MTQNQQMVAVGRKAMPRLSQGDLRRAVQLAEAAAVVYTDDPLDSPFAVQFQGGRSATFSDENGSVPTGYLFVNDAEAVLAFRGTTRITDWVMNFDATQTESSTGRVHRGFAGAVDALWPRVLEALESCGQSRDLWITGHSLGGAVAVLVASRVSPAHSLKGVVTFGQPRIGDEQFAAGFRPRLLRFTTERDLVPKLPWGVLSSYRHCGEGWQLLSNGRLIPRPEEPLPWGEMFRLTQILAQRAKAGQRVVEELLKPALAEHGMKVYLDRLKLALGERETAGSGIHETSATIISSG